MNIALNREATADKSREVTRKTNGQFETLTLDTALSEAVRELAYLEVAEERFDANGIRHLYESDTYPLVRRA